MLVAGVVMGGAAYLFYHLGLRNASLGLASFGVTVVALFGLVLWEQFHAPPFQIQAQGQTVTYQFRDTDHAQEFATANGI